ncbi:OTU-like cysteine protease [Nesidiocoris tenuis]|uniref:OTU-like cysteine protease n=1 Tax=Nesidiocoris tenuis TaxID=355587 RepID=A0ABN7AFE3_9HEMI|nr:OTU-like cysteine protease [Nesidiocoris tenuis]
MEDEHVGDDIQQRHKREKKELLARIQALKKTATKGDKKKKKEVQEEISRLEAEMEKRHAAEIKCLNGTKSGDANSEDEAVADLADNVGGLSVGDKDSGDEEVPGLKQHRITKAQRRRERKALQTKERELRIIEQEAENVYGVRNVELETIKKILKERDLMIHEIPSDGNCLYCAVDHQLEEIRGSGPGVQELRQKTGTVLKENPNEYLPFLSHPDTGEMFTEPQYYDYCNQVMDTTAWGGQVELRALSEALKCGIEVIQSDGPSIIVGEEYISGGCRPLVLTYHRNMYSLGEHYNSVQKYRDPPEDGDENGVADGNF